MDGAILARLRGSLVSVLDLVGVKCCLFVGRIGAFLMSDFATEAQLLAVEDEIHRHRSEGGFQGDEYEIALILVAAARHGADRKVIARETGARNELLEIIENRMVAARLWRDGVVETGGWLEEEGFAGFYEDVLVALGKSVRILAPDGIIWYIPARELSQSVM